MSSAAKSRRDLRIDFLRGMALLIVILDHIRGNPLRAFTPGRLGFSDMAEVFLFLSGYVCGIAYGRRVASVGFWSTQRKASLRSLQIYLVNLLWLAGFVLIICAWSQATGSPQESEALLRLSEDFDLSGPLVVGALLLEIEPLALCVLPLYIVMLSILPALLFVLRKHSGWVLLGMVELYLAVQCFPEQVALPEPWRTAWFFNPFAWQLVFFLGVLAGVKGIAPLKAWLRSSWAPVVAATGVVLAFLATRLYPPGELPFSAKIELGPLRLAHFACLAVLAWRFLPGADHRCWRSAWARPLVLCGQHSLATYGVGGLITTLGSMALATFSFGLVMVAGVNTVAALATVLFAYVWHRIKTNEQAEPPAQPVDGWNEIIGDPIASARPGGKPIAVSSGGGPLFRSTRIPVHGMAVGILLAAHGLMLGWAGVVNAPVYDEIAHLPAGLSHWQFSNFDLYRVNPPLVRMIAAIPLLVIEPEVDWSAMSDAPYERPEFDVGRRFIAVNGFKSFWYFTICRWAVIPISMFGGWVCYLWARDLFGKSSGLIALSLWCVCPNILAWGSVIMPDVGAAAFGVFAGYMFWRWLTAPDWNSALLAGFALTLAELSKSTWIVLFILWPLLWLIWRIAIRSTPAPSPPAKHLAALLALSLFGINACYGFERSLTPLGDFAFISHALGGPDAHDKPGNRFQAALLGRLPVPLPANYVQGIDVQKYDFERGKSSYLRGEQKEGGWWYYYLYGLAVKTSLGTLSLFAVAMVLVFWRAEYGTSFRSELVLALPALVILLLVSSQMGFNRYVRYVLPALPFLFVFTSRIGRSFQQKPLLPRIVCGAGLAAAAIGSLSVYPHSISYFNLAAGGPLGGPAHLLDGNIDWGQDLLELKRFLDRHPEANPIGLAYFGIVDPQVAGVEHRPVPAHSSADAKAASSIVPGWYAISVNHLFGYHHFRREGKYRWDDPTHEYFQAFTPYAMAGYSIYIYHITPEDIAHLNGDRERPRS